MTITAPDLTTQAPRSPRVRIGGYAIIGRTIDKCRAYLAGNIGEYHYDCPLDNFLFGFKGVTGDQFKQEIQKGAGDEQMVAWLDSNGTGKSRDEIRQWSDMMENLRPYNDPERREWFSGECAKLGLDPSKTTLFEWLEADDLATFQS